MMSYCFDLIEFKNTSGIRLGMTLVRPCMKCPATTQDFLNMEESRECSVRETLRTKSGAQGGCGRRGIVDFENRNEEYGEREGSVCDGLKQLSSSV